MFKAFVPSITLPAGESDIRKGGGIGIICNGQTMRHDLEMKLANARNEEERHMYMRMMEAM